jgi:methyl-accepting chemotaxis protein
MDVMKNIPIIGKFLSILGVFGIFAILVTSYSTSEMRVIENNNNHLIGGPIQALIAVTRADRSITGANVDLAQLVIDTNVLSRKAILGDVDYHMSTFKRLMDQAAQDYPKAATDILTLENNGEQVVNGDCAGVIQAGAQGTSAQAAYLGGCSTKLTQVINDTTDELRSFVGVSNATQASLTATTGNTIVVSFTAVLSMLVLVMLGGFFGIRAWVVTPLKKQLAAMSRLSGGDYKAEVFGAERKDEVGAIARVVQMFKDAGIEKLRLETEAREQRANTDAARQHNEAEREAAAKRQAFVVASIGMGLEKLSGGDLLFRLTTSFDSAYEKLRDDFNATMDKLQQTMAAIASNTQGVRSGAGEITQAADDLSRRTEQQAASLEETAAALDQITATVRKTAENATEARNTVSAAKSDAERSGEVVREAVNAMGGIETSSKQIGNIIGVIDEIAFQTNLLALNAGVEAARAGDAGRGFAVVATEVRALAQRSADAAKEIKTLISASGQQVDTGVRLVGETGKALTRIVEQVARLNGLVADIAASAQEQATGLNQVNTAVNQMDQVTQQNAAMVQQANAASHSLAGEAAELARLVGQFQIGEIAEARAVKPAGRQEAPKARSPQRTGKIVTPVRQDGLRRDATAQLVTTGAAENWDEF